MRIAPHLLVAFLVAACSTAGRAPNPGDRPRPERTVAGIAPSYQPAFRALSDAVEARDDEAAWAILRRLEVRVDTDRRREGESDAGATERRLVENALELLRGFERILGGRARVDSLDLVLTGIAAEDEPSIRILLRATSHHDAPLVLRPGPSTLRIHSAFVNERGRETHGVREQSAPLIEEIWIDPRGVTEVELGSFPLGVPALAIAARTHWSLEFRAGVVLEGEETFPAMNVPIEPFEETVVAPFFPTNPVDPSELARYVETDGATIAPIMERAVRIPPERSEEALDLMVPVVARISVERLALIVPAIRWLARTTGPASDPLAWKEWLRKRAEVLEEESADASALDIPDR